MTERVFVNFMKIMLDFIGIYVIYAVIINNDE